MPPYLDRNDVARAFPPGSWQQVLFAEFAAALTSTARPFPCIFGTAGFKANQLRFAFPETLDAPSIAAALLPYVKAARNIGPNTSLVVIGRPGPVQSLDSYAARFWSLLRGLAALDPEPWPAEIPTRLDTPGWEFCFAGEPIFVVCNSPAHVARQSRRSTSLMMTFQPRWVFDRILGTPGAAEASIGAVRRLLAPYDLVPPSPALGRYGDPANREYAQYVLADDNETPPRCPFHTLGTLEEKVA